VKPITVTATAVRNSFGQTRILQPPLACWWEIGGGVWRIELAFIMLLRCGTLCFGSSADERDHQTLETSGESAAWR
jgi:hypothetical protein